MNIIENNISNQSKSPILIGGMHRSGTSLVAQVLESCGLFLGNDEDLIGPVPMDNPSGYWEYRDIMSFSEEFLQSIGGSWKNLNPLNSKFWVSDININFWLQRADSIFAPLYKSGQIWGWKDPRTTVMLPFWRQLFSDFKVVICVRNPLEVAFSLSKRTNAHVYFEPGLKLWLDYYKLLERDIESNEVIYIHYEKLMSVPDTEIKRLSEFIGLQPSDEQIKKAKNRINTDLYRGVATDELLFNYEDLPYGVIEVYQELCQKSNKYFKTRSSVTAKDVRKCNSALEKLFRTSTNFFDYFFDLLEAEKCLNATAESKLQELQLIIEEKEQEILFYSQSKSWRLTNPLRKIMGFFTEKK